MKKSLMYAGIFLGVTFTAYSNQQGTNRLSTKSILDQQLITDNMKSFISIFEIPALDFPRAADFYESVLDIKIVEIGMQGTQMGLFPSEGQIVAGVIVMGEGYKPSTEGVLIYLNGGDDLQYTLDKVVASGGQVVVPKTHIDEANGYFAMFIDTEGNKLGLHSLN